MTTRHRPPETRFRPPLLTAIIIGCLVWLTCHCLQLGHMGYPWATGVAFVTGGFCIGQCIRLLDDIAQVRAYKKRMRAFKNAAKDYGQSHFGNLNDARNAGLIDREAHRQ